MRLGPKKKSKKNSWVKPETRCEGRGKVVVDDKDSEICYTWTHTLSLSLLSCEILDQQVLTAAHL
jgi:hypothetical protein